MKAPLVENKIDDHLFIRAANIVSMMVIALHRNPTSRRIKKALSIARREFRFREREYELHVLAEISDLMK